MKIVYVFRSLAVWGGIERILTDKMNWLVAHGYEVLMVTADQGSHPLPYQADPRIRFTDLDIHFHHQYHYHGLRRLCDLWQRRRRFERRLRKLLDAEKPDVLVTTVGSDVGSLVRLKGSTPLVVESHTICSHLANTGRLRWLRRLWMWHWLRKADVLVALTDADAAQWRRRTGRVAVIPNMVHEEGKPVLSALTERNVLFVGRLEAQKQLDHLLTVWQQVHQALPQWTLTIFGEGELREWLREKISEEDMGVRLNPPTDRIFDAYTHASALVLTSAYEPFGLVIVEAMLCGVPVVAYDCPCGPRSIITDGRDGFLVRAQDTDGFAQRLLQLLTDERLRRDMGREAVLTARRYASGHIMPQWEALFQQLLKS